MTMIMESPPSKREALRSSRSNRRLMESHSPPPSDATNKRMTRRQRIEMEKNKPPSTRGLALAKSASARWQASRNSNRALGVDDDEEDEEEEVSMEFGTTNTTKRRQLPRRTASMDGTDDRPKRRPLQRNKSCDGSSMPHQRVLRRTAANHPALDRSSSVRRFAAAGHSSRRLNDRSKSERRFDAAAGGDRIPSRRHLMDNSSDDGARSSRRRHTPSRSNSGMADDSSRRRLMSRSMSSSARRSARKPTRSPVQKDASMKDGSSGSLEDSSSSNLNATPTMTIPGKGLDDSSRRRKEPTLSKLSINELRNRLVGSSTEEAECEQEGCDNNQDSMGSQANWEIGADAGPLGSDLNHDEEEED